MSSTAPTSTAPVIITRGLIPSATRLALYGPEGVGKSTLAAAFPGSCLPRYRRRHVAPRRRPLPAAEELGRCRRGDQPPPHGRSRVPDARHRFDRLARKTPRRGDLPQGAQRRPRGFRLRQGPRLSRRRVRALSRATRKAPRPRYPHCPYRALDDSEIRGA